MLKSRGEDLTIGQGPYARDDNGWQGKDHNDLLSVIKVVKPHVLIGTSTKPKAFTEEVVKEMSKHVERPIIFPLSNPTRLHEADPKDINVWSEGKALIATGSPFPPVEYNRKKYEVGKRLKDNDFKLRQCSFSPQLNATILLHSLVLVSARSCVAHASCRTKCL